jgi:hypothetical protein
MTSPRSSLFGVVPLSFIVLSAAALAATGDPLPDVDVSLDRKPGRLIKQVKTDSQGNFSFGFVREGEYLITVKPNASPPPRQVGADANPEAPGSTAKSFFESRSNTVRAGGTNPLRFQVIVNGASTGSAMRTMQSDAVQQIPVTMSGGQLGGRVTAQ